MLSWRAGGAYAGAMAWVFIGAVAVFELWLARRIAAVGREPGRRVEEPPYRFTAEEARLIDRYRFHFTYPALARRRRSVLRGHRSRLLVLAPWLTFKQGVRTGCADRPQPFRRRLVYQARGPGLRPAHRRLARPPRGAAACSSCWSPCGLKSRPPTNRRRDPHERADQDCASPDRRCLPSADPPEPHVGAVGNREPDDAAAASRGVAHQWKWSVLEQVVKQSATAVPVGDERRAMQLFNPGLNGAWATTNTLIAAVQVLLPGEIARAHRHSPAAIRFIMHGNGAYTAVEGEKVIMHEATLSLRRAGNGTTTATRPRNRGVDGRPGRAAHQGAELHLLPDARRPARGGKQAGERLQGALRPRPPRADLGEGAPAVLAAHAVLLRPDRWRR